MSGPRLIIGIVVMAVAVPLVIFFLLGLKTPAQFFTIAATTFLAWGAADLFASVLERPRLKDRTPGKALREDLERRQGDDVMTSRSSSAAADRS